MILLIMMMIMMMVMIIINIILIIIITITLYFGPTHSSAQNFPILGYFTQRVAGIPATQCAVRVFSSAPLVLAQELANWHSKN